MNWDEIRDAYEKGASFRELEEQFNVPKSTIQRYAKKENWQVAIDEEYVRNSVMLILQKRYGKSRASAAKIYEISQACKRDKTLFARLEHEEQKYYDAHRREMPLVVAYRFCFPDLIAKKAEKVEKQHAADLMSTNFKLPKISKSKL